MTNILPHNNKPLVGATGVVIVVSSFDVVVVVAVIEASAKRKGMK